MSSESFLNRILPPSTMLSPSMEALPSTTGSSSFSGSLSGSPPISISSSFSGLPSFSGSGSAVVVVVVVVVVVAGTPVPHDDAGDAQLETGAHLTPARSPGFAQPATMTISASKLVRIRHPQDQGAHGAAAGQRATAQQGREREHRAER